MDVKKKKLKDLKIKLRKSEQEIAILGNLNQSDLKIKYDVPIKINNNLFLSSNLIRLWNN